MRLGFFLLIRKIATDKVFDGLRSVGWVVIRTSFEHPREEAPEAACARQILQFALEAF